MVQLRQDYESFASREAEILIIGPEDAAAFSAYWSENQLPFIGIPDPDHRVLKLYGQEVKLFKFGRMPAQLMIDKAGIVRYVHYGHDMTDIPPNDEMLSLLDTLNAGG